MKISVDIDGTYTEYPEFFIILRDCLRAGGHQIGLLTVQYPGQWVDTQKGLWDFIITTDNAEHRTIVENDPVTWKKQKINDNSIDLHFDDYDGFQFKVNKK